MSSLIEEIETVIEPQVRPFCGPLFFARSLESVLGSVIANGSFGLVDTGKKKLLVTCHHVWDEFQKARDIDSELRILVCLDRNSPVVLSGEPIYQDKTLDIATFDMEYLLPACGGRKFYPVHQNPAPQVRKGDLLFFVGYPGLLRCVTHEGVGFGRRRFALNVSNVDGLCFHADISNARILYETKPESGKEGDWLGGISGSPCFLVRQGQLPLLVGFVRNYWMNLLWFTHARSLNQDGTHDV